uniref:BZIP domain-containing protein n=1 Tax=Panagrellus redivivus TaxID=6233 RepID=A0A7E4ZRT6_PANRE
MLLFEVTLIYDIILVDVSILIIFSSTFVTKHIPMVMEVPLLETIKNKFMLPENNIEEIVATLAIAANDEKNMVRSGELPNLNNINIDEPPRTPIFEMPKILPALRESVPKSVKEASITSSIDFSKSISDDSSMSMSDYSSGGEEGPSGSLTHNSRGRKRMYTDEERRRRKNRSSKLSRDKHSRRVKANQMRLQKLQSEYEIEKARRQKQRKAIEEKRKELCPSCLSIIDQTLEKLRKGENFIHLKWTARNCTGGRRKHINEVVIKEEIIESEVQHC